ncbi:uncharacterized protein BDZ99DRAFT_232181 [Mytilinidion resinicola]|uniref:RING-type domain-containing protein n=1 Tax=Mytilinidion resinicola TaxID=574789 RepID=A0A6A6Z088_9PEZI|nr:uncharacterized protein BDZ99DRAFT_232181 [Mytilinidion resinicola]KAF2814149.1 hypothetical protein BDZ99DRAFT_232181 [Mytilinidion resinicola]
MPRGRLDSSDDSWELVPQRKTRRLGKGNAQEYVVSSNKPNPDDTPKPNGIPEPNEMLQPTQILRLNEIRRLGNSEPSDIPDPHETRRRLNEPGRRDEMRQPTQILIVNEIRRLDGSEPSDIPDPHGMRRRLTELGRRDSSLPILWHPVEALRLRCVQCCEGESYTRHRGCRALLDVKALTAMVRVCDAMATTQPDPAALLPDLQLLARLCLCTSHTGQIARFVQNWETLLREAYPRSVVAAQPQPRIVPSRHPDHDSHLELARKLRALDRAAQETAPAAAAQTAKAIRCPLWKATHVPRRPVEGECPICREDMDDPVVLTWCKTGCGRTFHRECVDIWRKEWSRIEEQSRWHYDERQSFSCGMCRSMWVECGCDEVKEGVQEVVQEEEVGVLEALKLFWEECGKPGLRELIEWGVRYCGW